MCQLRFDADCFFGCLQSFLTDCVMKEAPETPEVAGAIVILLLAFSLAVADLLFVSLAMPPMAGEKMTAQISRVFKAF